MSDQKRAVLILGMHRSGTSAIARLISMLGFDLGSHLMAAREDNPLGFWENAAVIEFNENLMSSVGLRWDSLDLSFDSAVQAGLKQDYQDEIKRILNDEFAQPNIAIKDPRMCRLLPVWTKALESSGYEIQPVVVSRDPAAVARSLEKRDGMPHIRGLLLWLLHMADLHHAVSNNLLSIDYDTVMVDSVRSLQSLKPLAKERFDDAVTQFCSEFLSTDLYHHRAETQTVDAMTVLAQSVAEDALSNNRGSKLFQALPALIACYEGAEEQSTNQKLYDELSRARAHSAQLDIERQRYDAYVTELGQENQKRQDYIDSLQAELETRSAFVSSLTGHNSVLTDDAAKKSEYIESQQAVIAEKQTFIDSLQQALRSMETAREVSDKHKLSLEDLLLARDADIATKAEYLESLTQTLNSVRDNQQESDAYVVSLLAAAKEKDEYAESLQSELQKSEETLNSMRDQLGDRDRRIEDLGAHAAALQDQLEIRTEYLDSVKQALEIKLAEIAVLKTDRQQQSTLITQMRNELTLADVEYTALHEYMEQLEHSPLVRMARKLSGIKRETTSDPENE
jgi:hypothetical protein